MKIAVPSTGNTLDSQMSQSFGRTQFFIIADPDTMEYSVIENTAADAPGGAGIKAAQLIVDSGAKVVIAMHCGQNAANVLKPAGVKLMKGIPGTIEDQIKAYKQGMLKELTQIHPGYHGGGRV